MPGLDDAGRVRLTDALAKTLPGPAAGRAEVMHWDNEVEGFCLRVYATGRRVWMVRYRVGGKQKWITLGTPAELKATDARKKAGAVRAGARLGHDERTEIEERKAKATAPIALTFGEVAKRYLAYAGRKQRASTFEDTRRYLERHAAPLHGLDFAKVHRKDVAALRSKVVAESGPIAANRLRSALGAMYTWAMGEGIAEANPVIGLPREKEEARDRVLTAEELRAIWQATEGPSDFARIVRLLLLTGARREEVAAMAWSELDLDKAEWTLPGARAKNGRANVVPLSGPALDILAGIARREGRDLLFGEGKGGFSGWSAAKERLDAKVAAVLGKPVEWTLHDTRRTFATLAGEIGVQPHIVEALLNHVSGHKAGVAGVYNRSLYAAEKREAVNRWAEHVMSIVAGEPAKVVPLRQRRA